MLRRQMIAGLAVLLILATAEGRVQQSMKGYELYSWKVKGNWHYSLLPGTNRVKSYDEITTRNSERIGTDALEEELKKLPKGEVVFWKGDAPPGAKRSATTREIDLKHPSRKRIERIKTICEKLGLKLKLA